MSLLQALNLPPYPFRITDDNGRLLIFDEIRKKQLVLTPEEWVRQHFVQYLIQHKKYPRSLIKLEGGLKLNGLAKRTDIVVFNTAGNKIMLIECKAPSVTLTQAVFEQASGYNIVHKVPLLAISNGLTHHFCKIDFEKNDYLFLADLPAYPDLTI